jgi:hypothetical protein
MASEAYNRMGMYKWADNFLVPSAAWMWSKNNLNVYTKLECVKYCDILGLDGISIVTWVTVV